MSLSVANSPDVEMDPAIVTQLADDTKAKQGVVDALRAALRELRTEDVAVSARIEQLEKEYMKTKDGRKLPFVRELSKRWADDLKVQKRLAEEEAKLDAYVQRELLRIRMKKEEKKEALEKAEADLEAAVKAEVDLLNKWLSGYSSESEVSDSDEEKGRLPEENPEDRNDDGGLIDGIGHVGHLDNDGIGDDRLPFGGIVSTPIRQTKQQQRPNLPVQMPTVVLGIEQESTSTPASDQSFGRDGNIKQDGTCGDNIASFGTAQAPISALKFVGTATNDGTAKTSTANSQVQVPPPVLPLYNGGNAAEVLAYIYRHQMQVGMLTKAEGHNRLVGIEKLLAECEGSEVLLIRELVNGIDSLEYATVGVANRNLLASIYGDVNVSMVGRVDDVLSAASSEEDKLIAMLADWYQLDPEDYGIGDLFKYKRKTAREMLTLYALKLKFEDGNGEFFTKIDSILDYYRNDLDKAFHDLCKERGVDSSLFFGGLDSNDGDESPDFDASLGASKGSCRDDKLSTGNISDEIISPQTPVRWKSVRGGDPTAEAEVLQKADSSFADLAKLAGCFTAPAWTCEFYRNSLPHKTQDVIVHLSKTIEEKHYSDTPGAIHTDSPDEDLDDDVDETIKKATGGLMDLMFFIKDMPCSQASQFLHENMSCWFKRNLSEAADSIITSSLGLQRDGSSPASDICVVHRPNNNDETDDESGGDGGKNKHVSSDAEKLCFLD